MEEYVQQLLRDAGVPENTDSAVRQQLVSDLLQRAADMVNKRLIESMDEPTVDRLNALLDSAPDDPKVFEDFITQNVPNKETIAATALVEFRALYLGKDA